MQILPFEVANLNELESLQPPDWLDLKIAFRYYLHHFGFCNPIKIVINSCIVGIGTTIIHNDVAWLAHIVVHPDFRKQGIGKIITTTLIESVKKHSCKTILLVSTDLGKPVYEKIGFEIVGEYAFLRNDNYGNEGEISENIQKLDQKYFDAVLILDQKVSGEDRSNQIEDYFLDSFVYLEKNKICGYYLPAFGAGLIVAENEEAGIELIKLRNKTHNIATLPSENESALKFLKENNFKQYRTAKRMSLGEKLNWHPEMFFNRISGQIG